MTGKKYSSDVKQRLTTKITLSSKAIIQNGRADNVLPRQSKAKEFITTKPLLHEMLKGLI